LLGLVGVLLGDVLEDGLRGRLDELLRLLEPEAREAADLLDDLDLFVPGRGEDDVELVLLLGGAVTGGGAARRAGGGARARRGRRLPRRARRRSRRTPPRTPSGTR